MLDIGAGEFSGFGEESRGHVGSGKPRVRLAARVFRDKRERTRTTGIRSDGEIKLTEPLVECVQSIAVTIMLGGVSVAASQSSDDSN
jgi:hypothetical protein